MRHIRHYPLVLAASLASLAGCSAHPTRQDIGTATGAVVGGVVGSNITGGSTVGTVGGAAAGALIGSEIGKDMDRRYYYPY